MPQVTVYLTPTEADALRHLAKTECRKYQEQARYLLRQKLVDLKMLTQEDPEPVTQPTKRNQDA